MASPKSLTGKYLTGETGRCRTRNPRASRRRARKSWSWCPRQQSEGHHGVDPARRVHGGVGCVGRRKSTFLIETLYKAAARRIMGAREHPPNTTASTASNISTRYRYRPVADRPHAAVETRHLYRRLHADPRLVAGLPEAKARGYQPAASRSTSRAGAASLPGDGVIKIEMHFLPMSTSPATSAMASATIARRSMCISRASRSPTCST